VQNGALDLYLNFDRLCGVFRTFIIQESSRNHPNSTWIGFYSVLIVYLVEKLLN
jgi:hypothetical protein